MKPVQIIEFLRNHLKTVVRVCLVILGIIALIDAIPGIVDKHHAHTKAEHFPAFWAAFGFLGCLVLVIFSKAFGHLGIMNREDYYDE